MGKICKYSNLYDKDGNLLHSPGSYTVQECEELVDKLAKESPNSKAYANAMATLIHMYETKGNPHRDELIQKLIEQSKTKTTKADVINALNGIKDEQARKDGSRTKECIQDITEGTGESERRSCTSETNTTISTTA